MAQKGAAELIFRARRANEHAGKFLFHELCLHGYHRNVPADAFIEMINPEDHAAAFVAPCARILRGLIKMNADAKFGIDPGLLLFSWPREHARGPVGGDLGEFVFLSVSLIYI